MNTSTDHDPGLVDDIYDAVADAGFLPLDYDDDEIHLTDRDRNVLNYFAARGWDSFRIDADDAAAAFTLARWNDDGIKILAIDANGVELAEARFTYSAAGVAWFTAAVTA